MTRNTSRRDFIRGLAGSGVAVPWVAQAAAGAPAESRPTLQVQNDTFGVAFDAGTGRLHIQRAGGATFVSGGLVRVNTSQGRRTSSEPAYRHSVDVTPVRDGLGEGRQLLVRSADSQRRLDLELCVTLYNSRPAVFVEAVCRNVSAQPIVIEGIEPISAIRSEQGSLVWPGAAKILTNGPMYYDPGVVADFARPGTKDVRSWWNIGLFRGYQQEGLCCGYVENQTTLGQIAVRREEGDAVSLTAESVLAKAFTLLPGQTIRSGRFMMNIAPDPYTALETFAQVMGSLGKARVDSILNGWCSWFVAFGDVTEDEVLRNAEFAARTLKPFGLEFMQVDEGFQRWHGDWEGNARFPHGMKWLADRIRALGLRPGIWLAPYVISEPTEVFQKHPEWLLRHPDGRLKRVGPWSSEDSPSARDENPKRYGLDITHAGAAEWLGNLFHTVAHQWGYEFIKIDFVDWSLLSAPRYHDPTVTRAAAYRKGFEIMRRAIGPDCHLLDCGPGPVTVGLLDSMRIELDQPPVTWNQYFLQSASSAPAAAKRYYFHRRAWINDADHVCLNLLTPTQAQAAATLIALSGGNMISGDRLPDLDPTRLEILKKVYPAWGVAARPVDLLDTDRHSVFTLKVRRPFGDWTVLGIFNISETNPAERTLPLERLWLDPRKTYVAYDFWRERFCGEVQREVRVRLAPTSVTLLAIHERPASPIVISTDRHVMQGAIELENVSWDQAKRTLSGVSLGPVGTAHNVAVYVPQPRRWVQGGPFLYHDFAGYTLKMMDDHILRVHVRFDQASRVEWKVNFDEFFGRPASKRGT